jgi:hypothetical protein
LKGGVEAVQKWRLGGKNWRSMQNTCPFRASAWVEFLHRTFKFWGRLI